MSDPLELLRVEVSELSVRVAALESNPSSEDEDWPCAPTDHGMEREIMISFSCVAGHTWYLEPEHTTTSEFPRGGIMGRSTGKCPACGEGVNCSSTKEFWRPRAILSTPLRFVIEPVELTPPTEPVDGDADPP